VRAIKDRSETHVGEVHAARAAYDQVTRNRTRRMICARPPVRPAQHSPAPIRQGECG
jgi:hypothetical protein